MKRNLYTLLSLAIAGGALAGCDTDETACTTDADCAGYMCVIASGATDGVCSASCTDGCAAGYTCGGETGAECVVVTTTCADLECGDYICDTTANACLTSCTEATDCANDTQCDIAEGAETGSCVEVAMDPYLYVAVVSRAEGDLALNNQNPGPDIDGISVATGGAETFASTLESTQLGPEGNTANTREDFTGITNGLDSLGASPSECDLDAEPGYTAIGGVGGYAVVSFGAGREIVTGDVITVYEINSANCSDAATERPDIYEVYITSDTTAARNPGSADSIRTTWCQVGTQGGTGGNGAFTFDSANCPGM